MVERQLPKLHTGVRFPSSAPAWFFPIKHKVTQLLSVLLCAEEYAPAFRNNALSDWRIP